MYSTNLREIISSCASACVSVQTQRKFEEFLTFLIKPQYLQVLSVLPFSNVKESERWNK